MITAENKLRIGELSAAYEQTLRGFIGEVNDELTRENIRSKTIDYLMQIRDIVPIEFDASKIGICPVVSTHDDLEFNGYTTAILRDIEDILKDAP